MHIKFYIIPNIFPTNSLYNIPSFMNLLVDY